MLRMVNPFGRVEMNFDAQCAYISTATPAFSSSTRLFSADLCLIQQTLLHPARPETSTHRPTGWPTPSFNRLVPMGSR
jgi:hypothetical protein